MEQQSDGPTDLATFVVGLGAAMTLAGDPVYLVQDRLTRIARVNGADTARITAFPTYLMVSMGHGEPAAIELTSSISAVPRLDQAAALGRLVGLAERGEISPYDGLERLAAIHSMQPRFGRLRSVAGYAVLAMGICLVLRPAPLEVAAAAVLGAMVGGLRWIVRKQQALNVMAPVLAAFVVSGLCALAVKHELSDLGMRPMVAALVVFLPGAALTTAVLELAAGQMISGASRLVAGVLQMALLAFGILAGIEAVGVPRTRVLFDNEAILGVWLTWLGVIVFAVGVVVADSVPPHSLPSLLVVLYAAWAGQVIGNEVFGGYVAALLGSTVMTITAFTMERFPSSLPGQAAFLPGFWLLVPGALGLMGLARFAGGAGAQELLVTTGLIFAVALGVLCGTQVLAWAVATRPVLDRATSTVVEHSPWLRRSNDDDEQASSSTP